VHFWLLELRDRQGLGLKGLRFRSLESGTQGALPWVYEASIAAATPTCVSMSAMEQCER
jgi:hypothetical protein